MPTETPVMYIPMMVASSYWFYVALQPIPALASRRGVLEVGLTIICAILPMGMLSFPAMLAWVVFVGMLWLLLRHTRLLRAPLPLSRFFMISIVLLGISFLIGKWGFAPHRPITRLLTQALQFAGFSSDALWKGAVYLMGIIWSIWGGTLFVRTVLDPFARAESTVNEEELRRGRMIGNMERLLIYLLALLNVWSLASVTVAVKAIARFKKLEEQEFAEYFLMGTLSSLLFAVITVIVVLWLLP